MDDIVIRTKNLGKKYRIGKREQYKTLRDSLAGTATRLSRSLSVKSSLTHVDKPPDENTFWALKDVSFEVRRGQTLGIIGPNGAGKSTLLKLLTRITEPTEGRAEICGRVASLLEIGTGFHPELTGRDNIFLNGAILGMKRSEILSRFDEIVDFAEVEKFIDTPVKHYSSGMYLRLAFAVAAHLEPEILLVDEVLAVGDAAFQAKCMRKMEDVAHQGRTVLFISHNLSAVGALCPTALLLNAGCVDRIGASSEVLQRYLNILDRATGISLRQRKDRTGDGAVRITSLEIDSCEKDKRVCCTSRLRVTLEYRAEGALRNPKFLVGIYDSTNTGIFLLDSESFEGLPAELPAEGSIVCLTEPINLTPGRCFVNVAAFYADTLGDYVQNAATFYVESSPVPGLKTVPPRTWVISLLGQRWSAA
jgi:lipopolysaccharide transport system ATP-binding protein